MGGVTRRAPLLCCACIRASDDAPAAGVRLCRAFVIRPYAAALSLRASCKLLPFRHGVDDFHLSPRVRSCVAIVPIGILLPCGRRHLAYTLTFYFALLALLFGAVLPGWPGKWGGRTSAAAAETGETSSEVHTAGAL
jgi:hypothetical protein